MYIEQVSKKKFRLTLSQTIKGKRKGKRKLLPQQRKRSRENGSIVGARNTSKWL